MNEKTKRKSDGRTIIIIATVIVALIAIFCVFKWTSQNETGDSETKIISKSSLEKIIQLSDLSAFEAVYNGVAKVMNEEKTDEIDFYVSYEAKVKVGIDFSKVKIQVDEDIKEIVVVLPKIEIQEIAVDIASLDYIFINDKANTATVSERAYKKCITDVQEECNAENAIYELAEQNARSIVEALLFPFVTQLDNEYQLRIE